MTVLVQIVQVTRR